MQKHPKDKLPIVYPCVIYAGQQSYHHSMDLFKLFGEEEGLARMIISQPFKLFDLVRTS